METKGTKEGNGHGNGNTGLATLQAIVKATSDGIAAQLTESAIDRAVSTVLSVAFRPDLDRVLKMHERASQKTLNRIYWASAQSAAKKHGITLDE